MRQKVNKTTKNKMKLEKFKIRLNMTVFWKSIGEGRGIQKKKSGWE